MARPLTATKVKSENVKGKSSESRQAGITVYYRLSFNKVGNFFEDFLGTALSLTL